MYISCDFVLYSASCLSCTEVGNERFDEAIEFVKGDVCQYGGEYSPLWGAAACVMVLPFFHLSGFDHLADDVQKLCVINLLLQQSHKYIMVYVIEGAFDVELNEPLRPSPGLCESLQCGVT